MTVLITGAAGRIGRTLVSELGDRFPLRLTDRHAPDDMCGPHPIAVRDLSDSTLSDLCAGVDAIVHLAGHPNSREWDVVERDNIRASRRLIEAAVAAGTSRFIFASSIHAVGYLPADTPFADDMPYAPDSPYGVSKAAVEMLMRYAADHYGMTCIALRVCSFRERPSTARELTTWLSPGDCVRLFEAALIAPVSGFLSAWGMSANSRLSISGNAWDRLGYAPQDDAQHYAAALSAEGIDTGIVSEWPLLGGHFVVRISDKG